METKNFFQKSKYFIILLLWTSLFYSQNNSTTTDQLAQQLQSVSKNNAADIVYLQTSKNIYETEEDVWFKGYVLDAQDFTPSNRSKTVFVQLIEEKKDSIVWEKKYEIENGFVHGHLFLKSDLPEGTYTVAAYSSNSFSKEQNEFYALKKITVVKNITQKKPAYYEEKDSIVHFATFAEGGKLISGIQSRLAFKAVNSKGIPVAVFGTLLENDIPLLSFKSSHAGMGSFDFIPDESKKYHIELSEPKSISEKKYDIATIESSGKSLHLLSNNKEELSFKISQSEDSKPEKVFLRLQLRGVVYSVATGLLKKELVIKIPLNDVPQGIAEVTLFNEEAMPIAKRMVFAKHDQKLKIQTELNKTEFKTRDKANLKIKVTDQNGKAVVAHLGLSVYDAIYQNKADTKTIQSHYLLSTQLRGNIYNPAYYFNEKNKDRKEALDLLLLTQGWRDYVWNEDNLKTQGSNTAVVFDEINGKVELAKPDKKTVIKNSNPSAMVLFTSDESKEKELMMTDSEGFFIIGPKDLKKGEGNNIYIQLMTTKKPKKQIAIIDNSFELINSIRKSKTHFYPFADTGKLKPIIISPFTGRISVNQLKEVVVKAKKPSLAFRDKYIGQMFIKDYVCVHNILNCNNHPDRKRKPVEGHSYGTVVFNGTSYITIQKVYNYKTHTKLELLKNYNLLVLDGFYGKKVFYEAVYDEVTLQDSTPDYRNTLFWKSDIITDEKGEANIDFFGSDINSLFIGTIEGVSGNGLLGSENFEFKVKKREN